MKGLKIIKKKKNFFLNMMHFKKILFYMEKIIFFLPYSIKKNEKDFFFLFLK